MKRDVLIRQTERPDFADFVEPFCAGWLACREHGEQEDGEAFMRIVMEAYENSGPQRARRVIEALEAHDG